MEGSRPTLSALARTSKSLSEVSLDALWSHIDDFRPLILTFEDSDLCGGRSMGTYIQADLFRPLQSKDMERFRRYAGRVLTFGRVEPSRCTGGLRATTFGTAASAQPLVQNRVSPIFPKLRHLHLDFRIYPFGDIEVNLLISPSLEHLAIVPQLAHNAVVTLADHTKVASALHWMAATIPYLSSLTSIDFSPYKRYDIDDRTNWTLVPPQLFTAISHLVCGARHLSKLKVPSLSAAALNKLFTFPRLMALEIHPAEPQISSELLSVTSSTAFRALQSLTLRMQNVPGILKFLPVLRHSPLRTVGFATAAPGSPTDWNALFGSISEIVGTRLSGIRIIGSQAQFRGFPPKSPSTVLEPFLGFKGLRVLVLKPDMVITLDNDFVRSMTEALPGLLECRLAPAFMCTNGTRLEPSLVTFEGLEAFAVNCRHLLVLEINVNLSSVPSCYDQRQGRVRNEVTIALYLGRSIISNPSVVASYLSDVFPIADLHGYGESWDTAASLMKDFQVVRKQERSRFHRHLSSESTA